MTVGKWECSGSPNIETMVRASQETGTSRDEIERGGKVTKVNRAEVFNSYIHET
jgi:hypothetical protein